jgi:hypothetical protein
VNDDSYEARNPLSICPAPGWRAVYLDSEDSEGPGWSDEPLVGWGVFHVTSYGAAEWPGTDEGTDQGNEIHGVVLDGTSAEVPDDVINFWRYLGPGQPDPTPDEVAEERARRRAHDAIWHEMTARVISARHAGAGSHYQRWELVLRPDNGHVDVSALVKVSQDDPEAVGLMFGQLHALGIPVGPRYGDPEGTEPWWRQGQDEHQVAQQMLHRRVRIGRHGTRGMWQVLPAPAEEAVPLGPVSWIMDGVA